MLFGKPRGIAQRLKNVFTLQIRIVRHQLLYVWPAPICPTIMPTVTRMPLRDPFSNL